jgi:hypothetical protein
VVFQETSSVRKDCLNNVKIKDDRGAGGSVVG